MTLATDLMGLGMEARKASKIASGGTGPIIIAAAGSNQLTATQLKAAQYLTYINSGTGGVSLPPVGGDTGASFADDFVIHSVIATVASIYVPSGVTLNVGGAQYTSAAPFSLAQFKTLTCWPVTASQWFGLAG